MMVKHKYEWQSFKITWQRGTDEMEGVWLKDGALSKSLARAQEPRGSLKPHLCRGPAGRYCHVRVCWGLGWKVPVPLINFNFPSVDDVLVKLFSPPNFALKNILVVKSNTFNSKSWSLRRLPETGEGVDIQVSGQRLYKPNCNCTFPFSKGGRGDPDLN